MITIGGLWPSQYATTLYSGIKLLCGDSGSRGTFVDNVSKYIGFPVDIVKRNQETKWFILLKRWILERTFVWLKNSRP